MFAISLNVALSQPEIQNENFVGGFVESNAKVVRLNISMDKMPIMDILNSGDHLIDQHEHSLKGKLP